MRDFDAQQWALVLGGSSGMGLATAEKLARHGMSVCIVHRDRRGAMPRIQPRFDAIAARGVGFRAFNMDALAPEGREEVLAGLKVALGEAGRVRLLLHSIALANLKLIAPHRDPRPRAARDRLAAALGIDPARLTETVTRLFGEGEPAFSGLVEPPTYDNDHFLEDEDFLRTVHAMGTSLVGWVQAVKARGLFADDARVIALTSEGNRAAWRGYAAASAAKAALEAAARSIAVELAPHGIRCNVVQAGVTHTPALDLIPGSKHLIAGALARNPFRRLTRPEDVAGAICLLATDEAAWINGALVAVDGGERCGG